MILNGCSTEPNRSIQLRARAEDKLLGVACFKGVAQTIRTFRISKVMTADFTFILAGKFGVGKTSLFKRIQTGGFSDLSLMTNSSPDSGGSDGELEHLMYEVKLNNTDFKVSFHQ